MSQQVYHQVRKNIATLSSRLRVEIANLPLEKKFSGVGKKIYRLRRLHVLEVAARAIADNGANQSLKNRGREWGCSTRILNPSTLLTGLSAFFRSTPSPVPRLLKHRILSFDLRKNTPTEPANPLSILCQIRGRPRFSLLHR